MSVPSVFDSRPTGWREPSGIYYRERITCAWDMGVSLRESQRCLRHALALAREARTDNAIRWFGQTIPRDKHFVSAHLNLLDLVVRY